MIRTMLFGITFASTIATSLFASAAPTFSYYPETGRLLLQTDVHTPMVSMSSFSGGLIFPPEGLLPGSVVDTGDIPLILTYFDVPAGYFDLGNRLQPNLPAGDFTAIYWPTILQNTPVTIVFPTGPEPPPFALPEPSTLALGSVTLLSLAALRRCK